MPRRPPGSFATPAGSCPKSDPGSKEQPGCGWAASSTSGTDSPARGLNAGLFSPPGAFGREPWRSWQTCRGRRKRVHNGQPVGNGGGHSQPPHTLLLLCHLIRGPCKAALACHLLQAAYPELPGQRWLLVLWARTGLPLDSVSCSSFLSRCSSSTGPPEGQQPVPARPYGIATGPKQAVVSSSGAMGYPPTHTRQGR